MTLTRQVAPKTKRPHFATLLVMALAPQEVGARIRKARIDKGWTHDELARAMGVNSRTVQRWQKGVDRHGRSMLPRLRTLQRLADVLEVPSTFFVESEDGVREDRLARVEEQVGEVRDLVQEMLDEIREGRQTPPAASSGS